MLTIAVVSLDKMYTHAADSEKEVLYITNLLVMVKYALAIIKYVYFTTHSQAYKDSRWGF